MVKIIKEGFNRLRLAIIVIFWGDLLNGNVHRLYKMKSEIDYMRSHWDDLDKDELYGLIFSSKADTGLRQHVAHILTSLQTWRLLNAERRELEVIGIKDQLIRVFEKCLCRLKGIIKGN